jgi:hypothetical protein
MKNKAMKLINKHLYLAFFLLSGMLVVSCKDNDIVYSTDNEGKEFRTVSIAMPLGKVSVPLYETIKKEIDMSDSIAVDTDGTLYVTYTHQQTVAWENGADIGVQDFFKEATISIDDLLPIDESDIENLFPGIDIPASPLAYSHADTVQVAIEASSTGSSTTVTIDEVIIASGTLTVEITLPGNTTGDVTFGIQGLQKNGSPFTDKLPNLEGAYTRTYNLEDYSLISEGDSIGINYTVNLLGSTNPAPSGDATIEFKLEGIEPKAIFGDFGQEVISEESGLAFDFFNDLGIKSDITINDIGIKMDVKNSQGLPIGVKGDIVMSHNGVPLDALSPSSFDFTIAPASYTAGGVTKSATSHTFITSLSLSGSGNYPDSLKFKIEGKLNPAGTPSPTQRNFLVKNDDSKLLDIDLEMKIPFKLQTSAYERKDTIAFDFNDLTKDSKALSENIEEAQLTLSVTNGLPFHVTLSLAAIDSLGVKLEKAIIEGQPLTKGDKSNFSVLLTQTQIKEFKEKNVKNLVLESGISTEGVVTLKKEAFLDVEISFRAKVNLSTDLFE